MYIAFIIREGLTSKYVYVFLLMVPRAVQGFFLAGFRGQDTVQRVQVRTSTGKASTLASVLYFHPQKFLFYHRNLKE